MPAGMARLLPLLLALAGLQDPAPGWRDAFREARYETAADRLHAIVVEPDYSLRSQDPEPARHLAVLYAKGLGVPRDPIAACSLAGIARLVTQNAAPRFARDLAAYQRGLDEADRFYKEHCAGLTDEHRRTASRAIGCYALAMPEELLPVGGQLLRVGRDGIGVADAPDEQLAGLLNCPMLVARVRATSIHPPPGAVPEARSRHVVEVFAWTLGLSPSGARVYVLRWHPYEVVGDRIAVGATAEVLTADTWPRPAMPPGLDERLSLEMNRDGQVRWRLEGTSLGGWLPAAR